jgi:hypothetical protein
MDLDRDSLELMLNLLDTDSRIKDALDNSGMNKKELEKNKQKVQFKAILCLVSLPLGMFSIGIYFIKYRQTSVIDFLKPQVLES